MNNIAPDLKLLQCFEVLMAERSVSRAAARLNMSQPAMSHALGRLRQVFDDPLLLKGDREMTPTQRALALQGEVHDLLASAERLTRKPSAFVPDTAQMKFTVMAAEHVEYVLAPRLIAQLQKEAPGIDIDFVHANREQALRLLERSEIDLRLGWWPEPAAKLRYRFLFRDRLVCIARQGHSQIDGKLTADEFVRTPHIRILTRSGPSHRAIDQAVAGLHRKLRVAVRVQNAFDLSNIIAGSDFVATVPERQARMLAGKFPLQILRLPVNVPDVRIAMYWHEHTHKEPAHRWFRDRLAETAKAI
jgi:DNA-binding transcriptional LysR family regulator